MSDLKEKPSDDEKRQAELLADAFHDVLSHPSGKRVLFWILEQCAIYHDGYTGENNATNYVLGQQSVGKRLINQFDLMDPLIYPMLLLDIAKLKIEEKAAAERAAKSESDDDDAYAE